MKPTPKYAAQYSKACSSRPTFPAAVRSMCLQCVGWERQEVLTCADRTCALWQIRKRLFKVAASAGAPAATQE